MAFVLPRGRALPLWIAALLSLAVLAIVSTRHSLALAIRGSDVDRAYALAPGDARIMALHAEGLEGPGASADDFSAAAALARRALARDATIASALSTLGIAAQVAGDRPGATRFMALSQRVSRRDLRAQIWAIEAAVARDDVPGALKHYDIALRTEAAAQPIMFPVLAAALSDPELRSALARTLARGPIWAGAFLGTIAVQAPDARSVAALFADLRRRGFAPNPDMQSALVNQLVQAGQPGEAWAVYAAATAGTDPRRSRDPGFAATPATVAPFDWNYLAEGGRSASGGQGALDYDAASGAAGLLARQMQRLPAGRYRLSGRVAETSGAAYWLVACVDGRELVRLPVPVAEGRDASFAAAFSVPGDCGAQWLSLAAATSDAVGGTRGSVRDARIVGADR